MSGEPKTVTFGVIADTHVPDRAKHLQPEILETFKACCVEHILHAGDASSWNVVRELEVIAPVTIVQGNRDILFGMQLPKYQILWVNNLKIVLAHGHRSFLHYLVDKLSYFREGYRFDRYYQQLHQDYPDADMIVFGHTHHQTASWVDGQLLFNPGVAYPCHYNNFKPQFGMLSITAEGLIRTRFFGPKNVIRDKRKRLSASNEI
ncbi:MAG: metallophosphoesterase family protein [Chloroflexota bacterium]|nr:metallophosphoesterase family protein [Chloroflexota bacterium]